MKRMLTTLLVAFSLVMGIAQLAPTVASAAPGVYIGASQSAEQVCEGVKAATGATSCRDDNKIGELIRSIVNILSWVVGVVAVIMIIVGGFKYVTSNGESSQITSAKHTIIYAIVGLVVVALAQSIVFFVISRV